MYAASAEQLMGFANLLGMEVLSLFAVSARFASFGKYKICMLRVLNN